VLERAHAAVSSVAVRRHFMERVLMELIVGGNSSSGVAGVVPFDLFFRELIPPNLVTKIRD
jgi:hypothetical protein